MKEKIINIRNILKIIISLFVIFAMIKSCSHAAVNTAELTENLNKIKDAGLITGIPSLSVSPMNSYIQNNDNYFILITDGTATETNYRNKIIIGCYKGNVANYTNDSTNGLYPCWIGTGNRQFVQGVAYNFNGTKSREGNFNYNNFTYIYAYTTNDINTRKLVLGAGEEYGQSIIVPAIKYTPFYDVQNLKINNITGVYGQKLIWTIGCRLRKNNKLL